MYQATTSCGEIGLIFHRILYDILGYKENGVFIEVGANDGKTGSFTYNLGKVGWTGVNCEPIPRLYELCCKHTNDFQNVKNLRVAVGESEKNIDIIDAGTLSTMDPGMMEVYLQEEWSKSHFHKTSMHNVQMKTLDTILNDNLSEDERNRIDVMVIDVEGFEEQVLSGFSIETFSPTIIVIEISDQHPSFVHKQEIMERFSRLRTYFEKNCYNLVVNDIVDNVYVKQTIPNIESLRNKYQHRVNYPQYIAVR